MCIRDSLDVVPAGEGWTYPPWDCTRKGDFLIGRGVSDNKGAVITVPVSYTHLDVYKRQELAYAITIHKSQGSEYPAVVIPIFSGPKMLMTRNLIYTAVTRARACRCV